LDAGSVVKASESIINRVENIVRINLELASDEYPTFGFQKQQMQSMSV